MADIENFRERTESVCSGCSEDMDDIELFALTDLEVNHTNNLSSQKNEKADKKVEEKNDNDKPLMSLRQRRHSRLFTEATPLSKMKLNMKGIGSPIKNRNAENGIGKTTEKPIPISHRNAVNAEDGVGKIKENPILIPNRNVENGTVKSAWGSPKIKGLWKKALKKAKSIEDPWGKFHIDELPTENVIRHRYSAKRKKWVLDECQVKMEKEAFNRGAMRACFRLKKLSSFSHKTDWQHAMNYVAKRYFEDVDRDVYFEDVKLQMDAKLWGEEYDRHNPPKKVDIFQMCILEFKDRPGRSLYHLEHYIEGEYIKYNSNSGFVEEHLRHTPQAFSHFTFERSRHKVIVVDIQGVGDLWTDPQIHTDDGVSYGDGNLGTRGMALFFHSHICNSICQSLGLSKFDLSENEIQLQEQFIKSTQSPAGSVTVAKGKEEMCISASPMESSDLTSFLANRSRTTSTCSQISEASSVSATSDDQDFLRQSSIDDVDMMSPGSPCSPEMPKRRSRVRFISECDSESSPQSALDSMVGSSTLTEEEEKFNFRQMTKQAPRPSCINAEIRMLGMNAKIGDSTLGQVHHDLAKYHELGRFSIDHSDIDLESAFYHERMAASLGVMEAIKCLAYIYLGMPREILVNYEVEDNEENKTIGLDYMYMAAKAGCRSAMIHVAKAYETGIGLSVDREIDWNEAATWYQKAVDTEGEDDSGEFDGMMEMPVYQIIAKIAEMYLSGGPRLKPDPNYSGEMYTNAADAAMAAMKGRMANKYYALAEEAWAEVEE